MEEFRLMLDMYGDKDNFGLLVIYDQNKGMFRSLPTETFSMEDATPEEIGKFVTEYLKKHCMLK